MNMFRIYQPVEVIFGEHEAMKLGDILAFKGYERAFLLCDAFLEKNGLAKQIADAGDGRIVGISGDIEPDPTVQNIDDNKALVENAKADVLIALGGGSTMDCTKSVAVAVAENLTGEQLLDGASYSKALPMIFLPTTAGTGSEVTSAAGITDKVHDRKGGIMSPLLYAKTAIVDPVLTYTCPKRSSAISGLDALAHAMDVLTSVRINPYCEALAVKAARMIFANLEGAVNDNDPAARGAMSEASLIAGFAFSQIGTSASHACAPVISEHYHIPHGEACAFTLPSWIRFAAKKKPYINELARNVGFEDADDLAARIDALKEEFGLRTTLTEIGGSEDDIPMLAKESFDNRNMRASAAEPTLEEVEDLYRKLL